VGSEHVARRCPAGSVTSADGSARQRRRRRIICHALQPQRQYTLAVFHSLTVTGTKTEKKRPKTKK